MPAIRRRHTIFHPVEDGHLAFDRTTGTVLGASPRSLRNIEIPAEIAEVPVRAIADEAFSGCSQLHMVTLPNGLTTIGRRAFEGCGALRHIRLPDSLQQMGIYAFAWCGLLEIDLPARLRHIPAGAFLGCPLGRIILPYGVREIGDGAFWGSFPDPTDRRIADLPRHVTDNLPHSHPLRRGFADPLPLPASLLVLGSHAFAGSRRLTEVTLPPSLYFVGDYAFAGSSIRRCTVPSSVTTVHELSFGWEEGETTEVTFRGDKARWQQIKGLTTPLSRAVDKTIDRAGSAIASLLTLLNGDLPTKPLRLRFTDEPPVPAADEGAGLIAHPVSGGFLYFESATGTVVGCDVGVEELTIPDEIGGVPVTAVGERAFASDGSRLLSSVTLPDTVERIGREAFFGCSNLHSVTLPSGLQAIGDSAFEQCGKLWKIPLPPGLTALGERAFARSGLTEVVLPDSLTTLADCAFACCGKLSRVTLPRRLTAIACAAFWRCFSLREIALPEGLSAIGPLAFAKTSLEQVTVPASVEQIGDSAFVTRPNQQGSTLARLTFAGSEARWAQIADLDWVAFLADELMNPDELRDDYRYEQVPDAVNLQKRGVFPGQRLCMAGTVHNAASVQCAAEDPIPAENPAPARDSLLSRLSDRLIQSNESEIEIECYE